MAARVHSAGPRLEGSLRLSFWALAVALGLLQVWAHRYQVQPDGTSYIEIARSLQQRGPQALINGYWSPLYPFLLSCAFRILRPVLYWESTVVHFLNLAIYLGAFYCFEIFLGELLAARTSLSEFRDESQVRNHRAPRIWGYLLFLWATWFWISPAEVTPDLCVACAVFLATAALVRIRRGAAGWGTFAALGAILGAGYLAKAAMFPVAFVFLLSAFLLARSWKQAELGTLLAIVIFAAVAAPFLFALSKSKGRITFGDSGKINYAWYVDGAPKYRHWQGEPPGTGVPLHPTRRVLSSEPLYEFAEPVAGTYPPWYDPSYWYEGITPHLSAKGQLMALYRAANSYLRIWSTHGTMYFVGLAMLLLRRGRLKHKSRAHSFLFVWVPAYAALLMYELVHVEPRFVGGFGLVLLAAAFTQVSARRASEGRAARLPGLVMVLAPALAIAWGAIRDARALISQQPFEQWRVAQALHEAGISPGASVGAIGMGTDAYWAHLAGTRIIAEIPQPDEASFVNADNLSKQVILAKFSAVGARALITDNAVVAESTGGWRHLANSRYYIYDLEAKQNHP